MKVMLMRIALAILISTALLEIKEVESACTMRQYNNLIIPVCVDGR